MTSRFNPNDCDCSSCEEEREEMPLSYDLTCTCTARFARMQEHDNDCELWLIDEFWAGFLAWDTEREILVPTDKYPADYESAYVGSAEYADEYAWDDDHIAYQERLEEMSQSDADLVLTTAAFIDRMVAKLPEDAGYTWSKNDDGSWSKHPDTPAHTPGDWSNDWSGFALSDRHTATQLHFPNGVTVQGTSLSKAGDRDTPDFGLYLDDRWIPDGMAIMLPWQDYGLPKVSFQFAKYAIEEAYAWAEAGAVVEIGCIGAHGRTGTAMACMAVLADRAFSPEEAVAFVRTAYCHHAIETREQEWFVAWFHAQVHGLPEPARPTVAVAPPTVVRVEEDSPKASPSAGPIGDPNRKPNRKRRGKRGGKRNRARGGTR